MLNGLTGSGNYVAGGPRPELFGVVVVDGMIIEYAYISDGVILYKQTGWKPSGVPVLAPGRCPDLSGVRKFLERAGRWLSDVASSAWTWTAATAGAIGAAGVKWGGRRANTAYALITLPLAVDAAVHDSMLPNMDDLDSGPPIS